MQKSPWEALLERNRRGVRSLRVYEVRELAHPRATKRVDLLPDLCQ